MTSELEKIKKIFSKHDTVIVKSDISKTASTFTTTGAMRRLTGERLVVSGIKWSDSHDCACVYAGGWQWHSDDLYVVNRPNPGKLVVDGKKGIFRFNPKNLQISI